MAGNEVFAWLRAQPAWQQDLARRLAMRVDLDSDAYDDALRMVKTAHMVPCDRAAPSVQPITRDELPQPAAGSITRLMRFGHLQGVGLVSCDEELAFEPTGLTLVYGQNASGKSSYVRALKVLSRTVDRDCDVLCSVYAEAPTAVASADVQVEVAGSVNAGRTTLDGSAALLLHGMSVFDAVGAELYVNAQNLVQYIPPELRLLARLATLQDRMRRDIATEREALQDSRPSREGFPATTVVGRALAQLTGTDADANLAVLASLSEDEQSRLIELRALVAAAAASTGTDDALTARRDAVEARSLVDLVTALAERTTRVSADCLRGAAAAHDAAQKAVLLAARQLEEVAPGIGGDPWRILWEAARAFSVAGGATFPPSQGERCPLCIQPVMADAAARLAHFEEHVQSHVQRTASRAADLLAVELAACAPGHAETCRVPLLSSLHDRAPQLGQDIEAVIDGLDAHLRVMHADPLSASASTASSTAELAALSAWAASREARATALLAAMDPAGLPVAKAELAELDARERLAGSLSAFAGWQDRLRILSSLNDMYSALATNRITSAQRELTESEVGKALDAALTHELTRLSCTHLPVQLNTRTALAETKVQLRLLASNEPSLTDIVSEGERRALALSFFFAELSVINDGGGIIVDDPVSSLDDERRQYIADRLIAEAKQRQVVVFTHDLAFLLDLQTLAEAAALPLLVQGLWRLGNAVGRVDDHLPFKAMKLKARVGNLKQRAAEWDADPKPTSLDDAWHRTTAFYSDLRTAWERAVEERLFQGVVQRFQRSVKTQSLRNIEVTADRVSQIEEGMTRASLFMHDEPLGGSVPLPTRSVVSADLQLLVDFEAQVRGN